MGLVQPVEVEPADGVGGVHFIAIGGSGMSGVAAAYADLGVAVSGSDRSDSPTLRELADSGITTYVGHSAEQLGNAETVVVSSAIPESNPELAEARRRGLRIWHRSAALAGLMVGRTGVAVTGTHGKTTTTGMIASMLLAAGHDTGYVIGSPLSSTGRSSHLGTDAPFVVEADESDGSFMQYPARVAVVTNLEADHLDNWGTPQRYREGFVAFCSQPGVEHVVVSADDPASGELADASRAAGKHVVTFGESQDADVRLSAISLGGATTRATLTAYGESAPVEMRVPGRYNLQNAATAVATGLVLGAGSLATLCEAVGSFTGTKRRFEPVGTHGGVRIFDDYAHHPTEVRALLSSARRVAGEGRLVVCFQPHLFSRTVEFADEFAETLLAADVLVVCDVFPAREDPVDFPGVTGMLVVDALAGRGRSATYVGDVEHAAEALADLVGEGDLVLTVGAGDVTRVGPLLLEELVRR